ncbi:GGDEF and EAL domain-containing protein [uncultured Pseudomonas sp.]|uniref:sensor domain-containing diguanylate cyclase n=1 Tax=uncultured Pseudomonas sp. TaxID=114707 RepID=UPI0025E19A8A|nr:GGDEF and EAL domain-containing protein [uncultured Pseudomonas sp.]
MQIAPLPDNERERQAKVFELCVEHLDEPEELQALVALAGNHFAVPICLVSIVSEHQQWFMAKTGLDAHSTSRDVSFCAHAIHQPKPLEVPDALLDPRFFDNPLVTGAPGIRYYCGAPLLTENGIAIGSLCVIDTVPRPPMSEAERSMLTGFAEMVMKILVGIRQRNFFDHPTGLLNRFRLECDVLERLARGERFTLLALDIMQASALNDVVTALGYNFAQDLVLEVKQRVTEQLGCDLQLYKISPTRFSVILPEGQDVPRLSARMVEALQRPIYCHQIPVPLDPGIGILEISRLEGDGRDLEWLRRAIGAAEAARHEPGRCAWYQPDVDAAQRRAFILLTALVQALQSADQLSLHLQPRIDLDSGCCRSAEALLRWKHPVLGDISPAEFIPLAEKTALITEISAWVMHEALRILAHTRGMDFSISMNVTARDLESSLFMDSLLEELQRLDIHPSRLQLEFTESVLIERLEVVQQQLQRARQAGIDIAIDDFGTGYSNWAYLSRIPASVVKLDRSLVQKSAVTARDRLLVQSLVSLATRLGYRVTAEGIETAELLEQVKTWGCSEAQGFYLGMPMTLAAFEHWYCKADRASSVA